MAEITSDLPFRHYSPRHRAVAWVSQNLFDRVTYTVRHGLLKGMKRKGGLGWLPEAAAGAGETKEQAFWRNTDFSDQVVYDIGAFQGLLTLFFARQARRVISYEPNSRNHARLMENLRLNRMNNVLVRRTGLGAKDEVLTMVSSSLMPGGATTNRDVAEGIKKSNLPIATEEIPVTTLDGDIRAQSLPRPDFIKIDVEGAELPVLLGARETLQQYKPRLFLEMHGETMSLKRKSVAAIVDCLNDLGYTDIRHVQSGAEINAANSALAAEGHLYAR
jgi:FkbM family methyltransferase